MKKTQAGTGEVPCTAPSSQKVRICKPENLLCDALCAKALQKNHSRFSVVGIVMSETSKLEQKQMFTERVKQ